MGSATALSLVERVNGSYICRVSGWNMRFVAVSEETLTRRASMPDGGEKACCLGGVMARPFLNVRVA